MSIPQTDTSQERTDPKDKGGSPHKERPASQEAKAAERSRHIQIRNRRKAYLDKTPSYFSHDLELADPLLYDRLIRKFQTTDEREAEGRAKGYSGTLEADILRSEAKLTALANAAGANQLLAYPRAPDGSILTEDIEDAAGSKEDGEARWRKSMEVRFLRGDDGEFDYSMVDDDEALDDAVESRRDEEERYFESEEPSWVAGDDNANGEKGQEITGQTGIQDF